MYEANGVTFFFTFSKLETGEPGSHNEPGATEFFAFFFLDPDSEGLQPRQGNGIVV